MVRCTKISLTQRSIIPISSSSEADMASQYVSGDLEMATKTVKDATAQIETIAADAQKTMNDTMGKMSKSMEDMTSFGQDNMDAMVKSSEIATKAAEGFTAEMTTFSKKSFEEGVAAAKDMAAAKNVTELFEKQSAFFTASMDGFMKQAAKFNEMTMSASKDVFEPVNARATAATDMVKGMTA